MTDVMTFTAPGEMLPGPVGRATPLTRTFLYPAEQEFLVALEQRVRDLELVCKAQQTALNYVLVRWMKAGDTKDLKQKIWPGMEAADMVLSDV